MWRHRQTINEHLNSKALAALHAELDNCIVTEYSLQSTSPLLRLQRWFSQPVDKMFTDDEDSKQQWLEAVRSARHATNSNTAE